MEVNLIRKTTGLFPSRFGLSPPRCSVSEIKNVYKKIKMCLLNRETAVSSYFTKRYFSVEKMIGLRRI